MGPILDILILFMWAVVHVKDFQSSLGDYNVQPGSRITGLSKYFFSIPLPGSFGQQLQQGNVTRNCSYVVGGETVVGGIKPCVFSEKITATANIYLELTGTVIYMHYSHNEPICSVLLS